MTDQITTTDQEQKPRTAQMILGEYNMTVRFMDKAISRKDRNELLTMALVLLEELKQDFPTDYETWMNIQLTGQTVI